MNNKRTLILESHNEEGTINTKKKKFLRKRISPLRYPGGKSKLIDFLYDYIDLNKNDYFIEPYAGGSSVGLSLLESGSINNLVLNDLDYGIYSLFNIIKNDKDSLVELIRNTSLSHGDYYKAQDNILNNYNSISELESAWSLLIVNRLSFSGICKANPLGGKEGCLNKLLQRWNPDTLINRIEMINSFSDNIIIDNKDAIDIINKYKDYNKTTIFIDPPYVLKGKSLYNHYYEKNDHIRLASLLYKISEHSKADFLLTYDDNELIRELYKDFSIVSVGRRYSI